MISYCQRHVSTLIFPLASYVVLLPCKTHLVPTQPIIAAATLRYRVLPFLYYCFHSYPNGALEARTR